MSNFESLLVNLSGCIFLIFMSAYQFAADELVAEDIKIETGLDPFVLEKLKQNGQSRTPAPMRELIDFSSP